MDDLAEAWAQQTGVTGEQLKPWWKGFPRGRIERVKCGDHAVLVVRRAVLADLPLALNPVHRNLDAYDGTGQALDIIWRRVRH